jgi:hypothetical protein
MNTSVSSRFSLVSLSLLCAISPSGCSRGPSQQLPIEKTKPLPEVTADNKNLSNYQPTNPYTQVAPGLFSRTVYKCEGPPGYLVEVRDLSVAPMKQAENISLPGAAFVEVRYGTGVFATGEKRQELNVGSTFSVSQGQSFALETTSDAALTMRVHLITAR